MNPKNVYSSLIIGDELDELLFKVAFRFAESGLPVWFFSPEPFDKLPDIPPPDKHVLQLITFGYFRDCKALSEKLSTVHLWNKTPQVIIVRDFQKYFDLFGEGYEATKAGATSAVLLDSALVCSKKNNKKTVLIVAVANSSEEYKYRLQALHDIYFTNVMNYEGSVTLDNIFELYELC